MHPRVLIPQLCSICFSSVFIIYLPSLTLESSSFYSNHSLLLVALCLITLFFCLHSPASTSNIPPNMLRLYFLMALLATSISALPLNINLGAYSPALVVGDGEISFGGKQDVSNLMNALEGAAVTSAATANNNNGQAAAAKAAAAPAAEPQAATIQQATPAVADNNEAQITALQGMGKEIAPRIVKLEKSGSEVEKRDLQTLNAALNYASGALKNGPEIQLGTEAAGVGILQKPSTGAAAAAPANGAAKVVVGRRDVASDAKLKTTVTTMYIRGGPAIAKKNVISSSSSVEDLVASAAVEKREPSPSVVDGVNLNMAEGQVAELTFVETRNADEE
ncbi:hypothetical protein ACMFMG_007598 [Clarireedia jacksonii]